MTMQVVYINNDPDIFIKKCAFIKRLEKDNVLFSDRVISRKTGLIFITVSYEKALKIIDSNRDLLKAFDNGSKKAIVIA